MFLFVTADDLDPLLDAMRALTEEGRGWINLVPEGVERAELGATRSIPATIFGRLSGRGAPHPKITWTAPEARPKRTEPAHLGIEHPSGPKARQRLHDAGHAVPAGWVVVQDHPMRGLVVVPAAGTDDATLIHWALGAAEVLAPDAVGESWQAQVFRPR